MLACASAAAFIRIEWRADASRWNGERSAVSLVMELLRETLPLRPVVANGVADAGCGSPAACVVVVDVVFWKVTLGARSKLPSIGIFDLLLLLLPSLPDAVGVSCTDTPDSAELACDTWVQLESGRSWSSPS